MPNEFYTTSTLFTLGGTSMAVWIITSVLGDILGRKMKIRVKKWLALALSMFFALIGVSITPDKSIITWVIAVVNGFLIYLTAVGLNSISARSDEGNKSPIRPTSGEYEGGFKESWWQD